ncbi:RpiB/LacA/LacB family sugar-phosphate isomerase [Curtobacterium sp. BRB10]|uniref:RpiB/LacA/LacB family sugar-phosphate isomerase n=1 Tax=Curtobacterium sp. BRB10 TaxID=2962579 RepID=UPI002880FC93|nr:RpiB/LacA/LacB family sugar-phosphate isomerase [Curtobacterium sp. BRB10]MDT0234847.1 RpiB/LacA/LacB family sugar-phosphate isomerase [Curtobacterium sp. BRB10]
MSNTTERRVVVGADFAGFALKEAVKAHLEGRGWAVTDLTPDLDDVPMYHRVGFLIGAQIAEARFPKALAFCGSGMGIHIAASKCPHVHAAVCESVETARRAVTANNANVLAMGAFHTAPRLGMAMADAFLESDLGDGYEDWDGFTEYHRIGYDECERFDYEAYRANGFAVPEPQSADLGPEPQRLAF